MWNFSSPLSLSGTIPAGFHSQKLWWSPFLALEPWAWELMCAQDSLFLRGTFIAKILLLFSTVTHGYGLCMGQAGSKSPPLSSVSLWLLLRIFSCRTSIHLDFRQLFSMMVVLKLRCNFDGVMGRYRYRIYLLLHLDQKLGFNHFWQEYYSPGQVAQLVRVLSHYTKVEGSILSQGTYKYQPMNA